MVPVAALLALNLPPAFDRLKTTVAHFAAPATLRHAADFGGHPISADARQLATWIAGSRDNANAAFAIVDKKLSSVHVFDSQARLRASSLILLGSAPGDDTVPGIGLRDAAELRPHERTTPAGRFVVGRDSNARDQDVFWVSYENRLSMHPVLTTNPAQGQLERLATPRPGEERRSFGSINLPAAFFKEVMRPSFAQGAVVYILPEVKRLNQVFRIDDTVA